MSDANRIQLRYCEEDTWGTTPATRALQELRLTGESLSYNIANIVSTEIRDDRQVTDLIQTGAECGGGTNFELSYGTYDDFMEGALWSDWSADLAISEADDMASTATGFSTAGTANFDNISAGQWIKVGGFTANTNENNGYYLVTSVSATAGTLTTSPVPASVEAAAASKTITINGAMLRNGTTEHSYSIERYFADLSPSVYNAFTGMVVNQVNHSLAANSIVTGGFEFLGKSATAEATAMSSGAVTDATTTDVINAVANVANFLENNTAVTACLVQSLDFTLLNNVRGHSSVGQLGFCDIGVGQVDVTGTLNAYFRNKDLYDKYVAGTETSISFRVADAAGNAYIYTFHRVAFESDPGGQATGANTDIMENIGWRAIRDTTYDCTIQIDKFAA